VTAPSTTAIYTLSLHDALPIFSPDGLRRVAADRDTGAVRELRGVSAVGRAADERGRDRGREQDLVGPQAVGPLSDARDADHGRLHRSRGRADDRGADRVDAPDAVSAAAREPALADVLAALDRGEPLARDALQLRSRDARPRARADHAVPAAPRGVARADSRGRGRARLRRRGR